MRRFEGINKDARDQRQHYLPKFAAVKFGYIRLVSEHLTRHFELIGATRVVTFKQLRDR